MFLQSFRRLRVAVLSILLLAPLIGSPAAQTAASKSSIEEIRIPGASERIVAVRHVGGWFVAIGEGIAGPKVGQAEGLFCSRVWFSKDARSWELRFTATCSIEDIVYAGPLDGPGRHALVISSSSRRRGEPVTWTSTDGGKTWQEIRGEFVERNFAGFGDRFIYSSTRYEGSASFEQVKISPDLNRWETFETIPTAIASAQPPPRWSGFQFWAGSVYRERSDGKTRHIASSSDLQQWRNECVIPAPSTGQEHEMSSQLAAANDVILAGTMVPMGKGPVRFYRRQGTGPWERITPDSKWNSLHELKHAGGRFVAVSAGMFDNSVRISADGRRWKAIPHLRPGAALFAYSNNVYVFSGGEGTVLLANADASWDDFNSVPHAETVQTGENWETQQRRQSADELFALARQQAAAGGSTKVLETLKAAVAAADSASPEIRFELGRMLVQGQHGLPRNPERGLQLVRSAADEGNVLARLTYGNALITGQGGLVPVDREKGLSLLRSALADSAQASPEAKFNLGVLLFQGAHGLPADRPRGLKFLRESADGGFAMAQLQYAQALIAGTPELPADRTAAADYLVKAANQGVPQAAFLLGQLYEQHGSPQALELARRAYSAAAQLNHPQAAQALQNLEAKLKSTGSAP